MTYNVFVGTLNLT